ncbi:hypothetical protein AYK24_08400 [Thermoplasmatales archaeon SG8-52-4]|nr:MAG: hypothetical protein AYK24_08400 [Thermoplasmatales archaeon SG8-52-4]
MITQTRFAKPKINYSYGKYNKIIGDLQKIRITQGCPNNCPYCYEPTNFEYYIDVIDEIEKNKVIISDMNLLSKPKAKMILKKLIDKRINNKVVYYELECGIDFRFLDPETSVLLYKGRFGNFKKSGKWRKNIKMAWDWGYKDKTRILDAINHLKKAGFKSDEISIFMLCNWKIPYKECIEKLDLLKVLGVLVNDCWFDNQSPPKIIPEYWTYKQIKSFRNKCRKHNQLILFRGYDPET